MKGTFEPPQPVESEAVARWRLSELLHAGYQWAAAVQLADNRQVDLHVATDLLHRGCPEDTALRILL